MWKITRFRVRRIFCNKAVDRKFTFSFSSAYDALKTFIQNGFRLVVSFIMFVFLKVSIYNRTFGVKLVWLELSFYLGFVKNVARYVRVFITSNTEVV